MENTSYIALSRQTTLWRQLEMVANNIANSSTPGFKGEQPLFIEYVMRSQNNDRSFDDKLSFVQDYGTVRDLHEGPMTTTGNPLDVAINGDGYFVIDTDNGPRYTRGGHLRLDETGKLITSEGQAVLSTDDRPFFFAPNETQITVARDGTISTENATIGKLKVVRFADGQDMRVEAAGAYTTDQQPETVARPDILQGTLEESNVKPILEVSRMIQVQRAYEGVNKLVEMEHERRRRTVDTVLRSNA